MPNPTDRLLDGSYILTGPLYVDGLVAIAGKTTLDITAPFVDILGTRYQLGADPSGTFDSGPAFANAALAAAAAGGNTTITVPNGTFSTGQSVVITSNNTWIDGIGTLQLRANTNLPVIRFATGVTGGGVRRITIDGNKANNTAPGPFGNQGIYIGASSPSGATFVGVVGCTIKNCQNDGVYVLNSSRCYVRENSISACGTSTSGGTPIHFIQGTNDSEIIGNLCDSNAYGIYLDANVTTLCLRNRVLGNVVSNCFGSNAALGQGAGISADGAGYSEIIGNHSYGHTSLRGIYVFPDASGFYADYSVIADNVCNTNGHNGIDVTGNFIRILGNHCEANSQSGIYLSGNPAPVDSSWNIIAHNTCRNNGTSLGGGSVSHNGITLNFTSPGNVTDNIIINNTCTDNGTGTQLYGIQEWQGAAANYLRNYIAFNVLRGNATAPYLLLSTTDVIWGNGDGIFSSGGTNLVLEAASGGHVYGNVTGTGNVVDVNTAGLDILIGHLTVATKVSSYNGVATAGMGVPPVLASPAASTGQTGAVTNYAPITTPNDGGRHSYLINVGVSITTLGSASINAQVVYHDGNNNARTCTIPLCAEAGTLAAAANTADDWKGCIVITCFPNTAISLQTAGTFTSGTYDFIGSITQIK